MVAASATAILIDINLSTFARSPHPGPQISAQTSGKCWFARLTHAFLTARVNRVVSTPAVRPVSMGSAKEMFELK
jgi:hypothetical protein